MNSDGTKKPDANERVCNRISVSRTLLLELNDGNILEGRSEDISPRGVLVRTDVPTPGELLDAAGTLFIISDEGKFSYGYPCRVVRQKGELIALEIDKKAAAAFGNYMTKELLGR